jgi:tRNA(Arg) A34 adenosine deaminase TadA
MPLRSSIRPARTRRCARSSVQADEPERAPPVETLSRRALLTRALLALLLAPFHVPARAAQPHAPERRWMDAAFAMKQQALSRNDQPYGAVLVAGGAVIGEGPSRVLERGDPSAHAEREAIRDAQRRLGRTHLAGTILYSTSRPCPACEHAAAEAGVARMIHGERLLDAGAPRP